MTWFPKFLNPWTALAAAGIVIPALLILYFLKLRRREMAVPSTLLWRKAIQDLQVNAPFQKLRRNLLLLLQLLLLAFLLFALSRPVSNYKPGPGKTAVILIDRSASMAARDQEGGKSRLDEAKRRARELVAGMGKDSTATVIAFDNSAQTMQPFTADAQLLNSAIDRVEQTDRPTDVKLAFQLAEAQMQFDPEQLRPGAGKELVDVRVFSDGRVQNVESLRLQGKLTLERIGSEAAGNVAIVALSAKRNYERPTQVQVFARLANYGPEPVAAPVQLSVDGQVISAAAAADLQQTFLLPDRWDDAKRTAYERETGKAHRDGLEFKLDLAAAAVIKLEQLHKDGDQLAADDVAQVVVPPPKVLSVLLVTDGNYFLERAVQSLGLKAPDVIRPQAYEADVPTKYDVIVFDNYKPPLDEETKKSRLPEAGSFIWFGQVPDGIKTKIATTGGGTTRPAGAPPAPAGQPIVLDDVQVLDWKRDHPILANLAMNKLYAAAALKLDVPLDREVLVDGLKGPLVVLDRDAGRTHLIVAFDVLQSNWPLKVSFPMFLHNALQFMAVGLDVQESVRPGQPVSIPMARVLQADPNLDRLTLRSDAGAKREVAVTDRTKPLLDLPPFETVGLYKTDPPVPGREQIAVNLLDGNESNLVPNDKFAEVTGGGEVQQGDGRRRLELWWWLALVALVLLFVEWWVYTRRVHL